MFRSDELQATDEAFQSAQQEALDGLTAAGIPDLESIQTYGSTGNPLLISEDGRSSVAVLNFSAPSEDVQKEVERIREALHGHRARTYVTGEPAVSEDLTAFSFRDLRRWRCTRCPWPCWPSSSCSAVWCRRRCPSSPAGWR